MKRHIVGAALKWSAAGVIGYFVVSLAMRWAAEIALLLAR